jgi:trk system potassium uptake protein
MSSTRPIACSSYAPGSEAAPTRALALGVAAYVALILIGFVALRLPGALVRGNELSPTAALFMAVNAATLTGFQPNTSLVQYQPLGQITVLVLMAGGSLLSLIIGGVAVSRIIDLPYSNTRIAAAAVVFYCGAVLLGTLLLTTGERPPLHATFLAASAVGNVGLAIGDLPGAGEWRTHAVLLPLAVLGGLGVPVLLEVWHRLTGRCRCLSRYSVVVLTLTAAIYLIGVILPTALLQTREAAIDASLATLNARTAGFAFYSADAYARHAQWLILLLMVIGSAPGGTAGGLKVTTLAEIAQGTRRALRGIPVGRVFGIAVVWLTMYALIVAAGQIMLLITEPQIPADRMLFEVVSAMSNVGLSFGPVSLVGPGMYALCLIMLLGRVLPLLILIWTMHTTRDAELAVG